MLITINDVSFTVNETYQPNYWNDVKKNIWEPHTFKIFSRFLSKDFSYLDIGAWIGPTVLYGAQLSKRCYAFEPDPAAFLHLHQNLYLNQDIQNVYLCNKAIADQDGWISIGSNSTQGDSMSSMLFTQKHTWRAESVNLCSFIDKHQIYDLNFIKMDIEGGEALVLPSCQAVLKKFHPTLYLSIHLPWIKDHPGFFDMLESVISHYRNIYTIKGKINLSDLRQLKGFTEIIATDLEM